MRRENASTLSRAPTRDGAMFPHRQERPGLLCAAGLAAGVPSGRRARPVLAHASAQPPGLIQELNRLLPGHDRKLDAILCVSGGFQMGDAKVPGAKGAPASAPRFFAVGAPHLPQPRTPPAS